MNDHSHHHRKRVVDTLTEDAETVTGTDERLGVFAPIKSLADETTPFLRKRFKNIDFQEFRKIEEAFTYAPGKLQQNLQVFQKYIHRIIEELAERFYVSHILSNSTHLALPIKDLIAKAAEEYQKHVESEKYISIISLLKDKDDNARQKRQIPDLLYSLAHPIISDVMKSLTDTFAGDSSSFTNKVILPTLYDMLGDPESRYNLLGLWLSAKSAYSPLGWEMLKRQEYDTPEGTIIKIPTRIVAEANTKFWNESMPIMHKLLAKHLADFLHRAGDNVPVLLENMKVLDEVRYPHAGVLKDAIMHFVLKHGKLLQSSSYSDVNFYTLTEILKDLRPIKVTFLQIMIDFYKQNKDNFFDKYIGEGSLLHQQVLGPTVYAKPKPSYVD